MRLILCVLTISLFVAATGRAQTISSSPYSLYGIGMLYDRTSALNRNLSGGGLAIHSSFELNNLNAASYAAVKPPVTHITELGALIEAGNLRTGSDFSRYSTGGLSSLSFFFRIFDRWSSVVGIAPYSKTDYDISAVNQSIDQAPISHTGSGGVTQFYLGNGVQLTKNLCVGFTGSLLFGSITKGEKISSGISTGISAQTMTTLRNFNLDFGSQYTINVEENKRSLTLGLVYGPDVRFRTFQQSSHYNAAGAVTYTSDKIALKDYVVPWHAGAGLAYETVRSMVDVDLTYRKMSEANLGENAGTFSDSPIGHLSLEYRGNPTGQQYVNEIRVRAGGYYGQSYLHLNGQTLSLWGGSVGLVFPVNHSWSQISLSYNYNHLGSTDMGLIQQQSNVIVLDITFRDRWGVQRKFD